MNISEIKYKSFGKCLKVDNGILELIIPLEFGIRILKFGLIDGENLFCEAPNESFEVAGEKWSFYGGHRLWISPETKETYFPDDDPIEYVVNENSLRLIQPVDKWSNVIKEIEISMKGTTVKLIHKVENMKPDPFKFALWSISVMAPGGFEIIPLKGKATGWLHNRQLSLWPYTKMNDPRLSWLNEYVVLTQDQNLEYPIKFGINNTEGWGLYINKGMGFLKKYTHREGSQYPDNNVSYETYTCNFMLEMESLSPIVELETGQSAEHVEEWSLFPSKDIDLRDEIEISKFVAELNKI